MITERLLVLYFLWCIAYNTQPTVLGIIGCVVCMCIFMVIGDKLNVYSKKQKLKRKLFEGFMNKNDE